MTFDEIRAAYPELAVTLYALEPGGPVTLEIIAPDGQVFTFKAETADDAIEMAWPSPPSVEPSPVPEPNVFD